MQVRSLQSLLVAVFTTGIVFFSNLAIAQEDAHPKADHGSEEKFNPKEVIFEHIKDAHEWHLWGHTSLPLPVILYTDKGLETFSSGHFHHGTTTHQGNYLYAVKEGKIKVVNQDGSINEEASDKVWDFSITKNVASLLLSVTLLLIIFLSMGRSYKKRGVAAPKGLAGAIEPIIMMLRDDVAKPILGAHKYEKYMGFLLTVFFFILINNLLGLVPFFPGGANLSGNIAFTFTLAIFTFILVNVNGNASYWKHIFWMPGVPVPMKIFLAPIEFIGVFTKPISLMVRLFANMTAGHVLILGIVCLIFVLKSLAAATVVVPFTLALSMIELLVAFIQAFIFTLLSAVYISLATPEHHDAHHH
jgi:F-type H+-transporting ATPase subunit a